MFVKVNHIDFEIDCRKIPQWFKSKSGHTRTTAAAALERDYLSLCEKGGTHLSVVIVALNRTANQAERSHQ
jgi:hypothetical protein